MYKHNCTYVGFSSKTFHICRICNVLNIQSGIKSNTTLISFHPTHIYFRSSPLHNIIINCRNVSASLPPLFLLYIYISYPIEWTNRFGSQPCWTKISEKYNFILVRTSARCCAKYKQKNDMTFVLDRKPKKLWEAWKKSMHNYSTLSRFFLLRLCEYWFLQTAYEWKNIHRKQSVHCQKYIFVKIIIDNINLTILHIGITIYVAVYIYSIRIVVKTVVVNNIATNLI